MRMVYAATAGTACIALAIAFPWFSHINEKDTGYYVIEYNEKEMGVLSSKEEADEAFLNARKLLSLESDEPVYLDGKYTVTSKNKLFGNKDSEAEVEKNIYNEMKSTLLSVDKEVYIVDIDGLTLTLGSLSDVETLLNASKASYDADSVFHVELSSDNERLMTYQYKLVKADADIQHVPTVFVGEDSSSDSNADKTSGKNEDGILGMSFSEDIKVVSAYASNAQIMSVEDAINEVTKEKEENEVYTVVAGDTLSKIAKKYELTIKQILQMNEHLSEEDYLRIGDEVVVTVPKPEISVVITEQKSYTEEYSLPVEYIYNDNKYTTYSSVKKEGSKGKRDVVAIVTYCNGVETGREIIESNIIKEATAKVVEVGTKTPPTFIKPITGGKISSNFGYRILYGVSNYHGGVDWAVPVGTTVRASCGGTVIKAGWGGSYGYRVIIRHSDGSTTTYAHLSKILVKVGQKVSQAEKIALSGNTGNSTGPHVHFEITIGNKRINPLSKLR